MLHRDYVDRSKPLIIKRKKIKLKKKHMSFIYNLNTIAVLVVVLLAIFISIFHFGRYKNLGKVVTVPMHDKHISKLPTKPEERWHYIKELENNHHISIQIPTTNYLIKDSSRIGAQAQLTDKQRQLQKKMYNFMHYEPIHREKKKITDANAQQRQNSQILSSDNPFTWVVQCGSFKAIDKAELMRVQLAFIGIESFIIRSSGWNRVMLGPYFNRKNVNESIQNLRSVGIPNCIPIVNQG